MNSYAAWVMGTLLVVGATVAGCSRDNGRDARQGELVAQVDSLQALLRETRQVREDLEGRARPIELTKWQLDHLREKGLKDPLVDLARDLRAHPELIPRNPAPQGGGGFGFYDPEGIHLLTTRWVLAYFEDGHVSGHMILEFSVGDSGQIAWKVLASVLD
mgnify:FL=1